MFIGHYAVGFGTKKGTPHISLGTLFLAVQFLDLLWPIFLLLGWEHVRIDPGNTAFTPLDFYDYPISHSLLTAAGWGVLVGACYYAIRRNWKGAVVLFACVLSHWILDFFVHRPDLPLFPGSATLVGLGLWNEVPATIVIEGGIFIVGVYLYLRTTKSKDRTGVYALWCLIAFLVLTWIMNMVSAPPPSERAIAVVSLGLWLIVPWGYWIERHRVPLAVYEK